MELDQTDSVITMTLVLTGPLTGLSVQLGDLNYINGETTFMLPTSDAFALGKYHNRCWGAYVKDSDQLKAVQAEEVDENGNPMYGPGISEAPRVGYRYLRPPLPVSKRPTAVPGEHRDLDVKTPEGPVDDGSGSGNAETGDSGAETERSGTTLAHSVQDVILNALDPEDDSHWTKETQLASVREVNKILGTELGRDEIDAMAGSLTRKDAYNKQKGLNGT